MRWYKEKIISELKRIAVLTKKSPTFRDVELYGGSGLCCACKSYFGTFDAAKLSAGLVPTQRVYELPDGFDILTQELAYVFGAVYGDGFFDAKKIGLNVTDKDFAENFAKIIRTWSKKKPTIKYNIKHKYYEVRLYSTRAVTFLEKLPVVGLLDSKEEIKCAFLKGIYDAEGTVAASNIDSPRRASRRIGFYNSDTELLQIVLKLLKDVGFVNIKIRDNVKSGFGSKNKHYEIMLYGKKNLVLFYRKVGFSINRKLLKLENAIKSYRDYIQNYNEEKNIIRD